MEYPLVVDLESYYQGLSLSRLILPYKDKEKQKQYLREYTKRTDGVLRSKNRQTIIEIKKQPCIDCKQVYPFYVMDFDHRPGTIKVGNVSEMTQKPLCLSVLLDEVSKCDVVCSNCHRIRTWLRSRRG